MKHEILGQTGPNYAPCRYGRSKLLFRGPRQPLDGRYVAFAGSTETYGKFIEDPFPKLVGRRLGLPAVNLGCVNAGVDAMLHDPEIDGICQGAMMTVMQVTGATNLSNRFYTVHPRRNDRFLRASTVLRALYPEIDFSDFCFTRHMLTTLHEVDAERFSIVRSELQRAWSARMKRLLSRCGRQVLLLWFSDRLPSDAPWNPSAPLGSAPSLITRRMLDGLRPCVRGVVLAQPSARARACGSAGMVHGPAEAAAAAELPGVLAHHEAAEMLAGALRAAMA